MQKLPIEQLKLRILLQSWFSAEFYERRWRKHHLIYIDIISYVVKYQVLTYQVKITRAVSSCCGHFSIFFADFFYTVTFMAVLYSPKTISDQNTIDNFQSSTRTRGFNCCLRRSSPSSSPPLFFKPIWPKSFCCSTFFMTAFCIFRGLSPQISVGWLTW